MTTAIQKQETKRDIRALIQSDSVKKQIAMVLPKHLTADRMARVVCTAILKTPKLAECSPESLLQAMMLCSQAGLEPDGRNAHLIPYGNVVQVIFDWKGLVSLARRNGVENIAAEIVCENDLFVFKRTGEGLQFDHEINYRKPRGEMFASYCIWKDGTQIDGEVMTKDEIDGIRKRSRAGSAGPWVTDYNEMAKKTVVRRASKKWPLSSELAEAINDADSSVVDAPAPASKPIFDNPVMIGSMPAPQPEQEAPPQEATQDEPQAETRTPPLEGPAGAGTGKPEEVKTGQAETPKQLLTRMLDEYGVPFDDLVDYCTITNISKEADSWASVDDIPQAAVEVLLTPVKMSKILKTYGTKKPGSK